jgi:WD40 repeat protein
LQNGLQDGSLAVWDQRSGACITRMLLPSAARCVKFSAPPLDLLAVSEHDERVSLFDARRWGSGQTLALGGAVRGAVRGAAAVRSLDVSGIAFSPSVRS